MPQKRQQRPLEHTNAQKEVKELDSFECAVCGYVGKLKDGFMEGHHLVPYIEGGAADMHNMITLCRTCHRDYHHGKLDVDIRRF